MSIKYGYKGKLEVVVILFYILYLFGCGNFYWGKFGEYWKVIFVVIMFKILRYLNDCVGLVKLLYFVFLWFWFMSWLDFYVSCYDK